MRGLPNHRRCIVTTVQDRRDRIGSSDAPTIVGVSPYANSSEVRVQQRILGLDDSEPTSDAMSAGNAMEDGIARLWADRMGKVVTEFDDMVRHPVHEFLTSHPDRLIFGGLGGLGKPTELLECKLVGATMWRDWPEDGDATNVPIYVLVQVLHQLACEPSAERAHIAALIGTELRTYTIERDQEAIDEIVALEVAWWNRHIVLCEPCPPKTVEEARMTWQPPSSKSPVETSNAADVARLVELTAQAKEVDAEIESLKVRLCEEMGDAYDALSIDGKEVVRWRPSSSFAAARFCEEQPEIAAEFRKSTLDCTALKKARPDLHKAYSRPGSRRFTITKHAQELTQ